MNTAIDFGCYAIRATRRQPGFSEQIGFQSEQSEYVVLPNTDQYRQMLDAHSIPRAECEESLVVYGNQAARSRWLSRIPSASIFNGGMVPSDDPPARQILDLLISAMLPEAQGSSSLCAFTVPGSERVEHSQEFLSRLIRSRGYDPLPIRASDAAMLAEGIENRFTGVAIVMGAETSEISICRHGVTLESGVLPVGADWIDMELARQFQFQVWDESGTAWLDLESVREWKHSPDRQLQNAVGERERVLWKLYSAVLDRIAQAVRQQLSLAHVQTELREDRINVICCGGATQISGFASALTERFVDHDIAGRIQSVRTVDAPERTVMRGLLIAAELEARGRRNAA